MNLLSHNFEHFTSSYERQGKILSVYIDGKFDTPRDRLACWHEIVARARIERVADILIVNNTNRFATDFEAFVFAIALVNIGLDGLRLAIADVGPDTGNDMLFVAVNAVKRGASVKSFTNEADARRWLASGAAAGPPDWHCSTSAPCFREICRHEIPADQPECAAEDEAENADSHIARFFTKFFGAVTVFIASGHMSYVVV